MRSTLLHYAPILVGLFAVSWLNVALFRRTRHAVLRRTQLGMFFFEGLVMTLVLFNRPVGFRGILELVFSVLLITVVIPILLGGLLRVNDALMHSDWSRRLADQAPKPVDPFALLSDELAAQMPGMRPCRVDVPRPSDRPQP